MLVAALAGLLRKPAGSQRLSGCYPIVIISWFSQNLSTPFNRKGWPLRFTGTATKEYNLDIGDKNAYNSS
jgi:hypothetical protein